MFITEDRAQTSTTASTRNTRLKKGQTVTQNNFAAPVRPARCRRRWPTPGLPALLRLLPGQAVPGPPENKGCPAGSLPAFSVLHWMPSRTGEAVFPGHRS